MSTAIGILILLAVAGGWFYFWRKRKNETWEGVLADKQIHKSTDSDGDDVITLYLHVKLSDGSTKKVKVSEKVYNSLNVGDNVVKEPGQYNPRKA